MKGSPGTPLYTAIVADLWLTACRLPSNRLACMRDHCRAHGHWIDDRQAGQASAAAKKAFGSSRTVAGEQQMMSPTARICGVSFVR